MVAFIHQIGSLPANFGGGYEAVGKNKYTVTIIASKDEPTRDQKGVKLTFTVQIAHGKYVGMSVPISLNVGNQSDQAREIAYGHLEAICQLCGFQPGQQLQDTQQLHGKPFNVFFDVKYLPPMNGNGEGTVVNEMRRLERYVDGEMHPVADTEVPSIAELKAASVGANTRGFSAPGGGAAPAAGGWAPPGGAAPAAQPQAPAAAPAAPAAPAAAWSPPGGAPAPAPAAGPAPAAAPFVPPTQGGPAPGAAPAAPAAAPTNGVPAWSPGGGAAGGAPGWSAPR